MTNFITSRAGYVLWETEQADRKCFCIVPSLLRIIAKEVRVYPLDQRPQKLFAFTIHIARISFFSQTKRYGMAYTTHAEVEINLSA